MLNAVILCLLFIWHYAIRNVSLILSSIGGTFSQWMVPNPVPLLLLSILLISRSMNWWKISCISSVCCVINCSFPIFWSAASSFSSQYLLPFLKSSRSGVLLLHTPFTLAIYPWMASRRRQFLLRIWPTHLPFLRRILFKSVIFSPIRLRISSLVTFSVGNGDSSTMRNFIVCTVHLI